MQQVNYFCLCFLASTILKSTLSLGNSRAKGSLGGSVWGVQNQDGSNRHVVWARESAGRVGRGC